MFETCPPPPLTGVWAWQKDWLAGLWRNHIAWYVFFSLLWLQRTWQPAIRESVLQIPKSPQTNCTWPPALNDEWQKKLLSSIVASTSPPLALILSETPWKGPLETPAYGQLGITLTLAVSSAFACAVYWYERISIHFKSQTLNADVGSKDGVSKNKSSIKHTAQQLCLALLWESLGPNSVCTYIAGLEERKMQRKIKSRAYVCWTTRPVLPMNKSRAGNKCHPKWRNHLSDW